MEEEWRDIFGYPQYQISNFGRVRKNEKFLNLTISKGYVMISLKGKKFAVHRLVAKAFIPNPLNKPIVNHKNLDRACNFSWNLEWVTNQENILDAGRKGAWDIVPEKKIMYAPKYSKHKYLSEKEVLEIIQSDESDSKLGRKYNVDKKLIGNIRHRRTWTEVTNGKDIIVAKIKADRIKMRREIDNRWKSMGSRKSLN